MGAVPLQVPGLAVRVWPTWAVPEMVGGEVFAGAADADCTTALGAEVAAPSGATPLVAVTTTRRVRVASALLNG